MELFTIKSDYYEFTGYKDKHGNMIEHGFYIWYYDAPCKYLLAEVNFCHGQRHGEFKRYARDGTTLDHLFFVNNRIGPPAMEMTSQEKLLFQIKYPGFRFIED